MSARRNLAWCLFAVIIVSVVVALVHWQPKKDLSARTENELQREVLMATVREIAAAANEPTVIQQVKAPARPSASHQYASADPLMTTPRPPDGYSFVEY